MPRRETIRWYVLVGHQWWIFNRFLAFGSFFTLNSEARVLAAWPGMDATRWMICDTYMFTLSCLRLLRLYVSSLCMRSDKQDMAMLLERDHRFCLFQLSISEFLYDYCWGSLLGTLNVVTFVANNSKNILVTFYLMEIRVGEKRPDAEGFIWILSRFIKDILLDLLSWHTLIWPHWFLWHSLKALAMLP